MTYQEATAFKNTNSELIGSHSDFLNHTIQAILIAPDNIAVPGITSVYKQTQAGESNELALQNLGFFNGSMNAYIIWEPVKDKIEQMPLVVYLAAAKK